MGEHHRHDTDEMRLEIEPAASVTRARKLIMPEGAAIAECASVACPFREGCMKRREFIAGLGRRGGVARYLTW